MGLLEGILGEVLKNAIGGNVPTQQQSHLPDIFNEVLKKTDMGSLGGLIKQMAENGLQKQIGSWLGNGQNLPVSPDQIKKALGNDQIKQIAQQMGVPVDQVLDMLTKFFPEAVNQASPDGELKDKYAQAEGRGGR